MPNNSTHFKDYSFLKKLIDNGFESEKIKYRFFDDTPNSCLVQMTDKASGKNSNGRLGISINKKKEIMATLLIFEGSFFWVDYGRKCSSTYISVPIQDFEDLLQYQIKQLE